MHSSPSTYLEIFTSNLTSVQSKGLNPNCLCNLIPAPESHRRSGLWVKLTDNNIPGLGYDPNLSRREVPTRPVGLRNLGNTCYVNSVLQCLFANVDFRNAILSLPMPQPNQQTSTSNELTDDPIIKSLQNLFIEMLCGSRSPVDPSPLIASLQLDHSVQQDGQEFMKLLLTLLEKRCETHGDIAEVIQQMYRGKVGYETVCQDCGKPAESSARADNFYELDVPVKGFKNVQGMCPVVM